MGHSIRLEGAQLLMTPQGGQWTPHRSPPKPQHQLGSGPTSQQGTRAAAESFVQFSRSVVSDSLRAGRLLHSRLPCASPTPSVFSNSCPVESVMPFNHLILCHPFLLLPSIFPSIKVFSYESALCIRRPKYWSFSFSITLSTEPSGLISFRMHWLKP